METTPSLTLEIISPTSSHVRTVQWVEIEGENGSFLAGPGHIPLVSLLKPQSTLFFKTIAGKEEYFPISSGIVSISNNKAVVFVEKDRI